MEVVDGSNRGVLIDQRRYEGYCIDLIENIANILRFKYQFELVPDGQYGKYDDKKKSWNGLIRRLLDRVCRILNFLWFSFLISQDSTKSRLNKNNIENFYI